MIRKLAAEKAIWRHDLALAGAAGAALFALIMWLWYPGILNWDAWAQYDQAISGRYVDWHPPIMAHVWRFLLPRTLGGGGMFAVQIALYCAAAIAFFWYLRRFGRSALLIFAVFTFPTFLASEAFVIKDAQMASALSLAFALLCLAEQADGRAARAALRWGAVPLLIYAALLRANGFLAVAPVVTFALRHRIRTLPLSGSRWGVVPVMAAVTAALAIVAVLSFGPINHRLLHAKDERAIGSLFLFDVAGIARFSHDIAVHPGHRSFDYPLLERCYTPRMWDPLANGNCRPINALPPNGTSWARAIATHPLAYLEHRAAHENTELRIATPLDYPPDDRYKGRPNHRDVRAPGLAFEVLHWSPLLAPGIPAFWLAVDLAILASLALRSRVGRLTDLQEVAAGLGVSAVSYWLGYTVFGVADAYRYSFYPLLATGVLIVVLVCDRRDGGSRLLRREKRGLVVLLAFGTLLSALHIAIEFAPAHALA